MYLIDEYKWIPKTNIMFAVSEVILTGINALYKSGIWDMTPIIHSLHIHIKLNKLRGVIMKNQTPSNSLECVDLQINQPEEYICPEVRFMTTLDETIELI